MPTHLLQGRGTPDEIFADEVADCPSMAQRLAGAEKIAGLDVVKEYSYTTEQAGRRRLGARRRLLGLHRSDLFVGRVVRLEIGQLAADAIIEGLQKNDLSAAQLGKWVPDFAVGTNWVRKLVLAFYCGQFRVGKFIREYPQHIGTYDRHPHRPHLPSRSGPHLRRSRPLARTHERGRRDGVMER